MAWDTNTSKWISQYVPVVLFRQSFSGAIFQGYLFGNSQLMGIFYVQTSPLEWLTRVGAEDTLTFCIHEDIYKKVLFVHFVEGELFCRSGCAVFILCDIFVLLMGYFIVCYALTIC